MNNIKMFLIWLSRHPLVFLVITLITFFCMILSIYSMFTVGSKFHNIENNKLAYESSPPLRYNGLYYKVRE